MKTFASVPYNISVVWIFIRNRYDFKVHTKIIQKSGVV